MVYNDSHKNASIKYAKNHLKRIPLDVSLEMYDTIKTAAESHGETVNGFIKKAVLERINALKD